MAITFNVYSAANNTTKSILVDFDCQLMSSSIFGVSTSQKYYFKVINTNKDTDGLVHRVITIHGLDQLALGTKRSISNSSADYGDIRTMIFDYIHDEVNGHVADQWSTGVTKKAPMKFD